jgi:hypothetical protein
MQMRLSAQPGARRKTQRSQPKAQARRSALPHMPQHECSAFIIREGKEVRALLFAREFLPSNYGDPPFLELESLKKY